MRNNFPIHVIFGLLLIIIFFAITPFTCTAPENTKDLLTRKGYTNIEVHGYGWFDCSAEDSYATEFTAVNPEGNVERGTVCTGLFFRNSTIRWE